MGNRQFEEDFETASWVSFTGTFLLDQASSIFSILLSWFVTSDIYKESSDDVIDFADKNKTLKPKLNGDTDLEVVPVCDNPDVPQ